MKPLKLRLTGRQHAALLAHLHPGDGLEAVAICLCGRRRGADDVLIVRSVHPNPHEDCRREPDQVIWPTDSLPGLLLEANKRDLAVLKIHAHPRGADRFSAVDDKADADLFASVYGWVDGPGPHASAIMLPCGRMVARGHDEHGHRAPIVSIAVAGDDFRFWAEPATGDLPDFMLRNEQMFGAATARLLRGLSVAVVGCSGTGSPTVEQLLRLGVGRLVLVDHDDLEGKNLNRILNAYREDIGKKKVHILKDAASKMGLGTEVVAIPTKLGVASAVRVVASCDLAFGCTDTVIGRHTLGRLCTFYGMPLIDMGVRIDADGSGGVDQVCGAVHYIQPDGSSLLSRGVYTLEELRAEELREADPDAYEEQLGAGYIRNAPDDSPAVVSVNMLIASLAVNEMLARVHPFRLSPNGEFWVTRVSLTGGQVSQDPEPEPGPCPVISRYVGWGDMRPWLRMPEIIEDEA